MDHAPLNILQVNTFDLAGGAERISWDLFREYRRRGHAAWLAVGRKRSDDPDVFRFPHHRVGNPWSRACWCAHQHLQPLYPRYALARFLCRATPALAAPAGVLDYWRGHEDLNYPAAVGCSTCRPADQPSSTATTSTASTSTCAPYQHSHTRSPPS